LTASATIRLIRRSSSMEFLLFIIIIIIIIVVKIETPYRNTKCLNRIGIYT
jgi:hypothetical protein